MDLTISFNAHRIRFSILPERGIIASIILLVFINPIFAKFETENIGKARIVVIYNLSFRVDTNDLDRVRHERMMLLIGNDKSMFASYNELRQDRILKGMGNVHTTQPITVGAGAPLTHFNFHIHKYFKENKLTYKDQVMMDRYIYETPLNFINWHLTDQKSEHMGHTVQKATARFGGRKWEAWFAPAIPISDGPYKFNGLPGLILKIQDTENHFVFSAESMLEPEEEIAIYRVRSKTHRVPREQFLSIKQNHINIWIQQLTEWGNCPEMIRRLEAGKRRRNNFIQMRAE